MLRLTTASRVYLGLVRQDGATNFWSLNDGGRSTAFDSVGGIDGTRVGGVIEGTFNGSSGVIQFPSMTVTLPVTIEFSCLPLSATPSGIFDTAPGTGNVLRCYAAGAVEWWNGDPNVTLGLSAGVWNHLVLVCRQEGGNRRVDYYRNGRWVSTSNGGANGLGWTTLRIGNVNNGSPWYNGQLANFAVYSGRALTASEASAHYGAAFAGMGSSLPSEVSLLSVPSLNTRLTGSETPSALPPRVDAGPDQYVRLNVPYEVTLAGSSPDTVTYAWTKVLGPGTATFDDATDPTTEVEFSAVGIYVLRLTVDDGALTNSRTVTITVTQQTPMRLTQGAVEVAVDEDTAQAAWVSQGAVEVTIESTGDELRVSQVMAELAWPTIIHTRVSQIVAEVLCPNVIELRLTQIVAELLDAGVHPIRVSQVVVELLGKQSTYCSEPSLSPAVLCGKSDVLAWLEWTVPMREK